jgi:hypothetical protein
MIQSVKIIRVVELEAIKSRTQLPNEILMGR